MTATARLLLAATLAAAASAPPAPAAPARGGDALRRALDDLDLDPAQREAAQNATHHVRRTLRENRDTLANLPPDERREEVRAVVADAIQEVAAALTPDQQRALAAAMRPDDRRPATRPADNNADDAPAVRGRAGPGNLRGLAAAVDALDLTDDQRAQIDDLRQHMRQDLQTLRDLPPEDRRPRARELAESLRAATAEILTDAQRAQLRDALRDDPPARAARPRRLRLDGGGAFGQNLGDDFGQRQPLRPDDGPGPFAPTPGPDLGDTPDPNLPLLWLDGGQTTLADLRGRPAILVFASVSSPHFRAHAAALDDLRQDLARQARWVWVYTAEAHPAGPDAQTPPRNAAFGVAVPPHATLDDRRQLAREAQTFADLGGELALDTMDDALARAFAMTTPGAILLTPDGKVAARQTWADAPALRELLARQE